METKARETLERIVKNLPIEETDYIQVPTDWGMVYIGMGLGFSDEPEMMQRDLMCWHGVYAIPYGNGQYLARTGLVSNCAKQEAVKHFMHDAVWMMEQFQMRDMMDKSYSLEN